MKFLKLKKDFKDVLNFTWFKFIKITFIASGIAQKLRSSFRGVKKDFELKFHSDYSSAFINLISTYYKFLILKLD